MMTDNALTVRTSLPCLLYHRVTDEVDAHSFKYCVSPREFSRQMSASRQHGVMLCDVEDLLRRLKAEEMSPAPCCAVTFDDGHQSTLWAAEEMANYGFRATFFIVRDFCERKPGYLSLRELRMLHALGHSLGVHGKTHQWWTSLSSAELQSDLVDTAKWLEDIVQRRVVVCSAPGGKINNRVRATIAQAGFTSWCTSRPALNRLQGFDGGINRIGVDRRDSVAVVGRKMLGDRLLYSKSRVQYETLRVAKYVLRR